MQTGFQILTFPFDLLCPVQFRKFVVPQMKGKTPTRGRISADEQYILKKKKESTPVRLFSPQRTKLEL